MSNETPEYMSLTDAAERLGYGSTSTLALRCREKKIPGAFKVGKTWIVPASWVDSQISIGKATGAGGPRGKGVRGKAKKII